MLWSLHTRVPKRLAGGSRLRSTWQAHALIYLTDGGCRFTAHAALRATPGPSVTSDSLRPPGLQPAWLLSAHGVLQARILEWGAILFCRGPSGRRDQIRVSCTAGRFFTAWATGKPSGCQKPTSCTPAARYRIQRRVGWEEGFSRLISVPAIWKSRILRSTQCPFQCVQYEVEHNVPQTQWFE